MDHYIDIHLRPDPEFPPHQLLRALYTKFHRALVQLGSTDIGVNFPAHRASPPTLGTHMRILGTQTSLQKLLDADWLAGMRDHITLSAIESVPADAQHCHVSRVQAKSNPERLRRRAMRRHGIDAATAAARIPDNAAEQLRLPFVQLGSRSTGQASFPLFIRHGPPGPAASTGQFNGYGLSREATVPWF